MVPWLRAYTNTAGGTDSIHNQNPACRVARPRKKNLSDADDSTCESWTIKKAKHQRIDAFNCGAGDDLKSPLDRRKIKSVNPKGNQP